MEIPDGTHGRPDGRRHGQCLLHREPLKGKGLGPVPRAFSWLRVEGRGLTISLDAPLPFAFRPFGQEQKSGGGKVGGFEKFLYLRREKCIMVKRQRDEDWI